MKEFEFKLLCFIFGTQVFVCGMMLFIVVALIRWGV